MLPGCLTVSSVFCDAAAEEFKTKLVSRTVQSVFKIKEAHSYYSSSAFTGKIALNL